MSNVKQFKRGLVLTPVSSDPASPVQGQYQESDGTARSAGLWRYDGTSWVEAGGSGGGGLDVFHTETFENNGASTFTTGNNAAPDAAGTGTIIGTLSDDASTQISGLKSLKYVQGATSINDFFIVDTDISVDVKQVANDVGVSFYYKYDGNDGDIKFVVLDQDDAVLSSSLDLLDAATTATRFTTSFYIPTGTTAIRYGFQTVVTNDTQILIVDDIELSLNPFVYKNISNDTDWADYTPVVQGFGTLGADDVQWRQVGSNYEVRGTVTTGTVAASELQIGLPNGGTIDSGIGTITVGIGSMIRHASANTHFLPLLTGGDSYINLGLVDRTAGGDKSTPVTANAYFGSTEVVSFNFSVPITGATSTTEHVVTPAKSNMTDWTSYTPTTTGLGTVTNVDFRYRRIGDSMEIRGFLKAGATTATRGIIEIPSGFTMDSAKINSADRKGTIGHLDRLNASTGVEALRQVLYTNPSDLNGMYFTKTVATDDLYQNDNATDNVNTGDSINVHASIPIDGWSSDALFLAAIPVQKVAYIDVDPTYFINDVTSTTSYKTRNLETVSGSNSSFVTIDSDQFTLGAGLYRYSFPIGQYGNGDNLTVQIYDITNSATYEEFDRVSQNNLTTVSPYITVQGEILITSTTVFELQSKSQSAGTTERLGRITITKLR